MLPGWFLRFLLPGIVLLPLMAFPAGAQSGIPGSAWVAQSSADGDSTSEVYAGIPPKRKSPLLAVGLTAVSPILGHAYIGGSENISRGFLYTGGEFFLTLAFLSSALSGFSNEPESDRSDRADDYFFWLVATHVVAIGDAAISVTNRNRGYTGKSYFISTAGAIIFPVIGHSHLQNPASMERAMLLSAAQIGLSLSRERIGDDYELYQNAVRGAAATDAYITTGRINEKVLKRETIPTIVPDIASRSLRLCWTF